ncbi:MAG: DUF1552 domain-containing protein [Verrucomicrobiota bacterium]|nr:DUF1552 domain-containing protein [Verrucomicrobiota bacterium]
MNTPYITTRPPLSRRAMLKGLGVGLSLPLLEAMVPSFVRGAVAPAKSPKRFVAVNLPFGLLQSSFFPALTSTGRDYQLSPYLEVLKELRDDFTVFQGLSHPEQNGNCGHSSVMTFLTAGRFPGKAGFKNSISLDQLMAKSAGNETRMRYLALTNGGFSGDSLAWSSTGVNIPAEKSPARLFQQLFLDGTPAQMAEQTKSLARGKSILDAVGTQAGRLSRDLGKRDQEKLDEYFSSVRSLEKSMQQSVEWSRIPKPKVTAKPFKDIDDLDDLIGRTRMMNELMLLAIQTDSTRIATYNLGCVNVPVVEGVNRALHGLSHHGKQEENLSQLQLVEKAELQTFKDFLLRLKMTREDNHTLLDQTAVLIGSNLGNANFHDYVNLPLLVAGGGFKHGQHLAFDPQNNVHLANLFVSLAQHMGVETDTFGTSKSAGVKGFEKA